MQRKTYDINFGSIDHFLYVRLNCICADLGFNFKEFIEQSYCHVLELIDKNGITHFEYLQATYKDYKDFREHTRYAPRMIEKKHSFVVGDISGAVYEHLMVIKKEHNFPWINILTILVMAMQLEMDKQDEAGWRDGEIKTFVIEEFMARRTSHAAHSQPATPSLEDGSYQIDKTRKRREYEKRAGIYPEREGFRKLDE